VKSGGDFGEFLYRFVVLFSLLSLFMLFTVWEKRSRHRRYERAWQTICHVLDREHSHEGVVLRGTWKGRQFEALANAATITSATNRLSDHRSGRCSTGPSSSGPPLSSSASPVGGGHIRRERMAEPDPGGTLRGPPTPRALR